jgi:hypothetical protein
MLEPEVCILTTQHADEEAGSYKLLIIQMLWCLHMVTDSNSTQRMLSLDELTKFVGMTPHYCFGFMAANGALLEAFEGKKEVHIVDFSTSHCMQWPTFIQALADRTEGPPHVRLTVSSTAAQLPTPPKLKATYEYLGSRLIHFASSRGVPLKFRVLSQPLEDLEAGDLDLREGECLGVNCALRLHYVADESSAAEFPGPSGAASSFQGTGGPRSIFDSYGINVSLSLSIYTHFLILERIEGNS